MNDYEYPEENHTRHLVAFGGCTADNYLAISEVYLSIYTAIMQVHPHMFGICTTGTVETRTDKRIRVGDMENLTMQPLGRIRL